MQQKKLLVSLWTGNFLPPLLLTGVAAMLPLMGSSLAASAAEMSLVMVCYNLGQTLSQFFSGRLCAISGPRKVLLTGTFLFCLFNLAMVFTPFISTAILLRFGQGISAGAISCCITSLCVLTAPPGHKGAVMGIVLSAVYLGLTLGPFLCGALTDFFGWRFVFGCFAILGMVTFFSLRANINEYPPSDASGRIRLPNAILAVGSLSSFSIGMSCGFLNPAIHLLIPVGLLLLGTFIRLELRSDNPILNLKILFSVPGLSIGMLSCLISYGSFFGLTLFFTLYLQQVLGFSATTSGFILMLQSFSQLMISPLAGKLSDRFGGAEVSFVGLGLMAFGILSLLWLNADTSMAFVILCQILLGGGMGFFAAPNMSSTLGNVASNEVSVASGLYGCLRTFGGLVSHVIVTGMISFHLGNNTINPDTVPQFMDSLWMTAIVFATLNFLGLALGIIQLRKKYKNAAS